MKKRHYYYIEGKDPLDPSRIKYEHRDIECDDTFDDELVMLTFPIRMMAEISTVLSQFGLRNDAEYFYSECREVVSVPEKHVNAQGQGKLTFQSYFHKFPDSILHFFDDALIVVIVHPLKAEAGTVLRNYNMIGYIHVNDIEFKLPDGKLQKGYYYNILRLSERTLVGGVSIYRRKRIFTTMFGILHDITSRNDMHYVYACMGKENQAIVDALKMNTEKHGKMFETFPMRNNTQVNVLYDSSSDAKKLVDITDNKEKLQEYYAKLKKSREKYIFDTMYNETIFFNMIKNITTTSSSRVMMVADANGKLDAAGLMINWGDYFHLKLQNPKGLFKIIDSLHLTDKLLHPTLLVGSQEATKTLLKGAAYKYRKEHGIKLTVMNAQNGDDHYDLKKSIIEDPFLYFVIYDRPEIFEKMKEDSKDAAGNVRLFIETAIP